MRVNSTSFAFHALEFIRFSCVGLCGTRVTGSLSLVQTSMRKHYVVGQWSSSHVMKCFSVGETKWVQYVSLYQQTDLNQTSETTIFTYLSWSKLDNIIEAQLLLGHHAFLYNLWKQPIFIILDFLVASVLLSTKQCWKLKITFSILRTTLEIINS